MLDYRIAAVGSDDEIRLWAGDETQVIELGGRLLVPGLIEGHGHFMSFGRAQQIIDLNDIQNWQQAVGRVAVAVDTAEAGEWIFGRGWHQEKWDRLPSDAVDGVPLNRTLSRISPNNPVLLGTPAVMQRLRMMRLWLQQVLPIRPQIRRAAPSSVTARAVPPACCEKRLSSWSPKQRRMIGPGVP